MPAFIRETRHCVVDGLYRINRPAHEAARHFLPAQLPVSTVTWIFKRLCCETDPHTTPLLSVAFPLYTVPERCRVAVN